VNEKNANPVARVQADKVVLGRESRGLTQTQLAAAIRLSQAAVSKIESGLIPVSDEVLARLTTALHYPASFFEQADSVLGASPGELYHRKRQSASVKLLTKLYAQVNIQRMQITRLLRSVEVECQIPVHHLAEYGSPEEVARIVRGSWGIAKGPIDNLTQLIESKGAIVIERPLGSKLLDGMSVWAPGAPPMFFMNATAPRSRRRHTMAHELGHVIMHGRPSGTMEDEASRFAAEFLMPAKDVAPELRDLTLPRLADLKLRWRVSMASLIKRAQELNRITTVQAKDLWIKLSKAGMRRSEPNEMQLPDERPTFLAKLFEIHMGPLHYSPTDIAKTVHLMEDELHDVYLPRANGGIRLVPHRA